MEQFSEGGPPNPRFLPKLSMTVQVNHKKLYYNYYTLGKYLLKIQISGKILRQPPPPPPNFVVIRGHSWSLVVIHGHSCVLLDKILNNPPAFSKAILGGGLYTQQNNIKIYFGYGKIYIVVLLFFLFCFFS